MNYYKNNIRHVKGDTYSSALVVEGLGQPLDSVYFTCRDSANDNSVILFEKSLADGGITIVDYDAEKDIRTYAVRIDPFDTRTLQIGTYFYDIQITVNSDVFTIMKGSFILEQDASKKGEPDEPEIIIQIKAQLDDINGETVSVEVFDKLDYLSNTKALMKDSLNLLGSEITDTTTFRNYVSKINDIYNEYPRTAETGTNFNITAKKGIMALQPKGNIEQATYTGKNLVNYTNWIGAYIGNDGNVYNDNSKKNALFVDYINVTSNTEYTMSFNASVNNIGISEYDSSKNFIKRTLVAYDVLKGTVTTTNNTTFIRISFNYNSSTEITDNIINGLNPIFETGNVRTTFEPYVGGVPSPNPDYPQEVKTVTGDNTIKITGKNLFDKNNANILNGYINNSASVITSDTNSKSIYISCKPNTTYTIQKILTTRFRVGYSSSVPEIGTTISGIISNYDATNITITTDNNAQYLVAWIYQTETNPLQNVLDTIQIEESETATTYEAYQETICSLNLDEIELCKIGDYQDYFYKENYNWYKHSAIGKVVLDGTENWYTSGKAIKILLSDVELTNVSNLYNYSGSLGNIAFCDYFTQALPQRLYTSTSSRVYVGFGIAVNPSTSAGLFFANNDISLTDFKTWLSTNNTTVYYVLETATDTQITDTTLINQLNALQEVMAIDGTNVISSECEEGNAPVVITATALMKGSE